MKKNFAGKRRHLAIILPILLVAVAAFTLPAFIFNEMEFQSRELIRLAYYTDYRVDEMIEVSSFRLPVALSTKERAELPDQIEKGIKATTEMLQDSLTITENQQKIPLLPKKYREYAQMKVDFLDSYIQYYETFLTVKEIEFRGRRIAEQLDAGQGAMSAAGRENFLEVASALGPVAVEIQENADRMYADGELTAELRDYYWQQAQNNKDYADYIFHEDKDWEHVSADDVSRELEALFVRGSEVDTKAIAQQWHEEIIDPINAEANGHEDAALEKMDEAGIYYMDENLDKDPITRALSVVFKNKYPKNKRVEVE